MNQIKSASYDLVVVGAGFAGLACARAAAALGVRTAILEQKEDPGAACRTTGILVKEAAEEMEVPRRLARRVAGIRLYGPSLAAVDLVSPLYYFLATDTPGILRWLAGEAGSAGAELLLGEAYRWATPLGGAFSLSGPPLTTRFLVGADGVRSRVARDFGLGRNESCLAGVEAELEDVRGVDQDRLHCFLDSSLAPGYIGWVVPGIGITQVGVASRPASRPRLDLFLERVRGVFDFSRARRVGHRAGLIPVGGPVRPLGKAGVLLIGDAAGLVSPLTAGGIHNALRYGRAAGRAIAEHLLDGGPEPFQALAPVLPRYTWKRVLRRALDLAPPNWVLDLALGSPFFRAFARTVFFHHRGLFAAQAWREILAPTRR